MSIITIELSQDQIKPVCTAFFPHLEDFRKAGKLHFKNIDVRDKGIRDKMKQRKVGNLISSFINILFHSKLKWHIQYIHPSY